MPKWKNLTEDERVRMDAIKMFLGRFPKIMEYIFHPTEKCLRKSPQAIRKGMGFMSSGEKLMANIALDLWGGYGSGVHIDDLIAVLDNSAFMNCMKAILKVKKELYEF